MVKRTKLFSWLSDRGIVTSGGFHQTVRYKLQQAKDICFTCFSGTFNTEKRRKGD